MILVCLYLVVTVAQACHKIAQVDQRIVDVKLVDFFEKKEWQDKRSVTLRYYIQDQTKTLDKQEIDAISQSVTQAVGELGATVR